MKMEAPGFFSQKYKNPPKSPEVQNHSKNTEKNP
jgi:hypothetical protein